MTVSSGRIILIVAAAWLFSPASSQAEDQLLVQKDFASLSDDDQWKANDVWCVAGIDLAGEVPGYSRSVLDYARADNIKNFMSYDGATQTEFDANLAYAAAFYRAELAAGRTTIDQMLEGCIVTDRP